MSSSLLKLLDQRSICPSLLKSPHPAPLERESDSSDNSTALFVKVSKLLLYNLFLPQLVKYKSKSSSLS